MPTALVTGSPDRVPEFASALESQGFRILPAEGPTGPGPASIDCYVQLPASPPPATGSALSRARAVIDEELRARFDTAARLAPLLAPRAFVVLVADNEPDGSLPAELGALRTLISLLAQAILRDHGPAGVRTTVVDERGAPAAIAALGRPPRVDGWSGYSGLEPDLAYTDWRDEILCLADS